MTAFFAQMNILETILFILAAIASLILVAQIILMLIGIGGGADGDVDGIDGFDGGDGVALFTLKGIIAFFSIGGWSGLAASKGGVPPWGVIIIAFLAGSAALIGISFLMKAAMRLQSNGVMDYRTAIGNSAKVYLTIPPRGQGAGKINVMVQGRYVEANARTEQKEAIKTNSLVKVVGFENEVFLVEVI